MRITFLATFLLLLVRGEAVIWPEGGGCGRALGEAATQLRQRDLRIAHLERELSKCKGNMMTVSLFHRDENSRNLTTGKKVDIPQIGIKAKLRLKRAKLANTNFRKEAVVFPTKHYIVNVTNITALFDAVEQAPRDNTTEVTIKIFNDLKFTRQLKISSGQMINFVSNANVTLDGQGKTRFFKISSGAASSFRFLVFENGCTNESDGGGGAIVNSGTIMAIQPSWRFKIAHLQQTKLNIQVLVMAVGVELCTTGEQSH